MHVTDWNGDGQADLLIGDVRWACYKLSPLTPKQLSEQAMVKPAYDEGRKAQAELMNERNALVRARKPIPEELTQRIKGQRVKYAAVNKQWHSCNRKRSNTLGWVWLYLRNGKAKTLGSARRPPFRLGHVGLGREPAGMHVLASETQEVRCRVVAAPRVWRPTPRRDQAT